MCCRWWPITTCGIDCHLENVRLPLSIVRACSHFQSPAFKDISHLWSLHSVLHRRTMSVIAKPDIWMWPPKPEIITSLELWQVASKFQRQIRDFRWWRARYKISQMIATTIDYHKLQDWRTKRLYCHFRMSVIVAITWRHFFSGSP